MKLHYVSCEYDIGLNIDGVSGCYSTEEKMIKAISQGAEDIEESFDELDNKGLLFFEEVEG